MSDALRYATFDELGRLIAEVILGELHKVEAATSGDMLVCLESIVVHCLGEVELKPKGREGKLLKQLRENAMQRLARRRVLEGKAQGNG